MTKSQYAELLETSEKHSIGLLEFVAEDGEPLCTYSTVHHSVVTAESYRHHTGRSVAGGRPGRGGEGRDGQIWEGKDYIVSLFPGLLSLPLEGLGTRLVHCLRLALSPGPLIDL